MITNVHPNPLLTDAQRRDLTQELAAELGRISRRLELFEDTDADDRDQEEQQSLLEKQSVFDAALSRIDTNSYGICIDCSEPIPYGRLILQPETERCANCQRAATMRVDSSTALASA